MRRKRRESYEGSKKEKGKLQKGKCYMFTVKRANITHQRGDVYASVLTNNTTCAAMPQMHRIIYCVDWPCVGGPDGSGGGIPDGREKLDGIVPMPVAFGFPGCNKKQLEKSTSPETTHPSQNKQEKKRLTKEIAGMLDITFGICQTF